MKRGPQKRTTDPRFRRRVEFNLIDRVTPEEYLERVVTVANRAGLDGFRISNIDRWEQDNLFGLEFLLQPPVETKAQAPRKRDAKTKSKRRVAKKAH